MLGIVQTKIEAVPLCSDDDDQAPFVVVPEHRHSLFTSSRRVLTDRSLAGHVIERAARHHVEIVLNDRLVPVPVRAPPRCG